MNRKKAVQYSPGPLRKSPLVSSEKEAAYDAALKLVARIEMRI